MIFRSKDLSEKCIVQKMHPFKYTLLVLVLVFSAKTGTYIRTDFTNGANSQNVINDSLIQLDIERYGTVKLFGDEIPGINQSKTSYYPDVFVSGDTFSFFYVDPVNNSYHNIFRADIKRSEFGYEPTESSRLIKSVQPAYYCYMHVDKGENDYSLSYIKNAENTKQILQIYTQSSSDSIQYASDSWLYSSQCYFENDTFLVVFSKGMRTLYLAKVYANADNIRITDTVTVTSSGSPGNAMNCSVGYDGYGTILVSWMKGGPLVEKHIHYKFFDSDLNEKSADSISEIASNNKRYFYDETAIASYGTGKFALVFWNQSGIWMSRLYSNGNSIEETTSRIVNKDGAGFCAAASNDKNLLVVYKSSISGESRVCGLQYDISDGDIVKIDSFVISDETGFTFDSVSTAINCVIDSSGDFGVTWRDGEHVKGSVFAYRGIRYPNGYWISPVESLDIHETDSVRFYPVEYDVTSLQSWGLESSIRVGKTVEECSAGAWFSLSDESVLESNVTAGRNFQYKVAIKGNSSADADSVATPKIRSVKINHNVKPVLTEPDSVRYGIFTENNFSWKDTITVLSRKDSVVLYTAIRDPDSGEQFNVNASYPIFNSIVNLVTGSLYPLILYGAPVGNSDTTVTCSISVMDNKGWESVNEKIYIKTRNSLPVVSAAAVVRSNDGSVDTVKLLKNTNFNIQETDTVQILYSVSDTNDYDKVRGYLSGVLNDNNIADSTDTPGVNREYTIAADTVEPCDTVRLLLSAVDPDTAAYLPVRFTINHFPSVKTITAGTDTVYDLDTVRVTLETGTEINISVSDTDRVFWDTLTYIISTRVQSDTIISSSPDIVYEYVPQRDDSLVKINVRDRFLKEDSICFYIKYPWLETDASVNPENAAAKHYLKSSPSLVTGSGISDTVTVPYLNNGNDTLHIISIGFTHNSSNWLRALFIQDTGKVTFTSNNTDQFKPQVILPDSVLDFEVMMFTDNLAGDSVIADTILVYTSDPLHPVDSIIVRLEYNDLPTILDITPYFIPDVPFVSLAKKKQQDTELRFPPHASMRISFSEPMDSISAVDGIYVYSIYDSSVLSKVTQIDLHHEWSQNGTVLNVLPVYKHTSPRFGYQPPGGLFIPTDSVALVLTNNLTDRAKTPTGPNRLDIRGSFERTQQEIDTTLRMKIDSVTFRLVSVSPSPGDTDVSVKPEIRLQFTSEVYARSVDTSLQNNRSLIVCSGYNNGRQLHFDSICVKDNTVMFSIAQTLFYRDSLWCRYRASGAKNLSGFPMDNDRDGIPSSLYDSASVQDDCFWSYRVKTVKLLSVSPENGTEVDSVTQPIVLTFSEPIPVSAFCTDTTSDNKSFQFRSMYSIGPSSYQSIRFSSDSTVITLHPSYRNFSDDSLYCKFNGFSSNYRYDKVENDPDQDNVFEQYEWNFYTGKIGFYTFPNPYKPGKDPRHCRDNGPCGIWFKNLHSLKEKNNDVEIRIYSMGGYPVYDTKKAGTRIHFETGRGASAPQWLWNTKNQKNEPAGSGLYFYVISDLKGSVLKKGKLIIVR